MQYDKDDEMFWYVVFYTFPFIAVYTHSSSKALNSFQMFRFELIFL